MHKAFLFDMDGVLVESESHWMEFEEPFYREFFGEEITSRMKFGPGLGIDGICESAAAAGAKFDKAEFQKGFEEVAMKVYDASPLSGGLDALVEVLLEKGFKIGIVTNSAQTWVDRVFPRLSFKEKVQTIVSLKERSDLKHKPAPDGFLEALKILHSTPEQSIVLEDSNPGIAAGKASGCYTIGYRGNLIEGYKQEGADAYADTMEEVARIVTQRSQT